VSKIINDELELMKNTPEEEAPGEKNSSFKELRTVPALESPTKAASVANAQAVA
jgi:hypothetical protein